MQAGKRILGYSLTPDGEVISSDYGYTIESGTLTLYAAWRSTCQITYHACGKGYFTGLIDETIEDETFTETLDAGETIYDWGFTNLHPYGDNVWTGWSLTEDGSTPIPQNGYKIPAGSLDIYAIWDGDAATPAAPETCTLTFDTNGGAFENGFSPAPITVEKGTGLLLFEKLVDEAGGGNSVEYPVREGYLFQGWSESPDGGTFVDIVEEYVVNADTTLYAIWAEARTVTFDANGGYYDKKTTTTYKKTVEARRTIDLEDYEPDYDDWEDFKGWSLTQNGAVISNTYTVTKNVTLYAIWTGTLKDAEIKLSSTKLAYNGKARVPAVTVYYGEGDRKLVNGTDYTLTYSNNVKAGTGKVVITGKGRYTGSVTKTFTITRISQPFTVKAAASTISAGQTTTVTAAGAKETTKYTFSSSNTAVATVTAAGKVTAKKAGTVKITATTAQTTNYNKTSKSVTIKVLPAAHSSFKAANQATGIRLTWTKVSGANGYIIYRGGKAVKTITSASTLAWNDTAANSNGTNYTYKIVAKASVGTGKLSRSVTIGRVARPSISSLKNSSKKTMKVKWGKNAKSSGYQIQYSLKSSFSGATTVTVSGASTTSRTIGSLKKGKTYYVRIRTYRKSGKATYYSAWSSSKKVKIKK